MSASDRLAHCGLCSQLAARDLTRLSDEEAGKYLQA